MYDADRSDMRNELSYSDIQPGVWTYVPSRSDDNRQMLEAVTSDLNDWIRGGGASLEQLVEVRDALAAHLDMGRIAG